MSFSRGVVLGSHRTLTISVPSSMRGARNAELRKALEEASEAIFVEL